MLLTLELPVFPHAVLYQQSLSAAAVVAQAAAATGGGASIAAGAAGSASGVADVIRFQDPEVGCKQQCSLLEPVFGTVVPYLDRAATPQTQHFDNIGFELQRMPGQQLYGSEVADAASGPSFDA